MRVDKADPGDTKGVDVAVAAATEHKVEPTPTIESVRDVVMTTLQEHKATPVGMTTRACWLVARLPQDLFVHALSFAPHLARIRLYSTSKGAQARFKNKAEVPWNKSLVLTHADEFGWYRRAKEQHAPWLPPDKDVRRVVVYGPDNPPVWSGVSPLQSEGMARSVTDLTVRGQGTLPRGQGTAYLSWPADLIRLDQWRSLTQLRMDSGSDHIFTKWQAQRVSERILAPLAARPEGSSVLTSLRVERLSDPWSLETAYTFLKATPGLWRGLEKLGLYMATIDDTWWTQLMASCPNLVKIIVMVHGNVGMPEDTLHRLGRAWPAMRYFIVGASGSVDAITATELRPLTSWKQLEILEVRGGGMEQPEDAKAPSADESDVLATCVASWPKMRSLRLDALFVIVTAEVYEAFNRHCPRLQFIQLGRPPIPDDWTRSITLEQATDFYRWHPHLRTWPQITLERASSWVQSQDERLNRVTRYCRDWRDILTGRQVVGEEALSEAVASLHQLRQVQGNVVSMRSDRLLFAVADPRGRPVDAPADWVPRARLLHTLDLYVEESVRISDAGLDAIVQTCPALVTFKVVLKDAKWMATSDTKVSVRQIQRVLRACPKLTAFHLDVAPLAGVDQLTDDLYELGMRTHHRVACTVSFRLGPFRDVSDESNAWVARHTTPLLGVPKVRQVRFSLVAAHE